MKYICIEFQSSFYRRFKEKRKTWGGDGSGDGYITVATQGSADRIMNLPRLAEKWKGPISMALILFNKAETERLETFLQLVQKVATGEETKSDVLTFAQATAFNRHVDIHCVHLKTFEDSAPQMPRYPINLLRNIALEQILTEYVFVLDIDLIPSTEMKHFLYWVKEGERSVSKN